MKIYILGIIFVFFPQMIFSMDGEKRTDSGYSSEGSMKGKLRKTLKRASMRTVPESMIKDLDSSSGSVSTEPDDSEIIPDIDVQEFLRVFFPITMSDNELFINTLKAQVDVLKINSREEYDRVARLVQSKKNKKKLKSNPNDTKIIFGKLINGTLTTIERNKKRDIKKSRYLCMGSTGACVACLFVGSCAVVSGLIPMIVNCYT